MSADMPDSAGAPARIASLKDYRGQEDAEVEAAKISFYESAKVLAFKDLQQHERRFCRSCGEMAVTDAMKTPDRKTGSRY
jgi:hypothetical protein